MRRQPDVMGRHPGDPPYGMQARVMIKLAERCDDCALARKPGGPVHG